MPPSACRPVPALAACTDRNHTPLDRISAPDSASAPSLDFLPPFNSASVSSAQIEHLIGIIASSEQPDHMLAEARQADRGGPHGRLAGRSKSAKSRYLLVTFRHSSTSLSWLAPNLAKPKEQLMARRTISTALIWSALLGVHAGSTAAAEAEAMAEIRLDDGEVLTTSDQI